MTGTHVAGRPRLAHATCRSQAPYRIEVGGVLTDSAVLRGSHELTVRRAGTWTLRPGPPRSSGPPVRHRFPDALAAPALHDAHVHLHPALAITEFTAHGVARVRDLGSRIGLDEPVPVARDCTDPVPEVVLGGPVLDRPGPPRLPTASEWWHPDDLPALLDAAVSRRASWIKLYARFPAELFAPVVRQAHTRGLRVALHPAPGHLPAALRAGVDEFEHIACLVPGGEPGAHPLNRRWAERRPAERWPELPAGVRLCPTLVVQHRLAAESARGWTFAGADPATAAWWRRTRPTDRRWTPREVRDCRKAAATMDEVVVRLARQGVRVVVGSDTPNPGVLPGRGLWEELNLLTAAGLPPVRTYLSASVTGAGLGESGSAPLTFLPIASFAQFAAGRRYPVAPVVATLLGSCLFTTSAPAVPAAEPVLEER